MVASPNVRRAHAKLEHRSNDQIVLREGTGLWGPDLGLVASSHPHSEGAWGGFDPRIWDARFSAMRQSRQSLVGSVKPPSKLSAWLAGAL